jgi:hypothetical protein
MRVATLAVGLLAVAVIDASGQGPVPAAAAPLPPSIERFLNNSSEALTHVQAVRRLEATNPRFRKHGWMDVRTELSPETGFTFHVLSEGGSDYIRKKVLRPILEGEREIIATGDPLRSALTLDNYEMTRDEPAEDGLVRLFLKPRRQERTLVDGSLLVSAADGDLVRVTGRLAKNPSFWTRRVDIVRHYGRIAGVRVPLSVESVAQVRIAGPSAMSMTYRYEMVNGRDVTDETIATLR